jgi:hypothetical protein
MNDFVKSAICGLAVSRANANARVELTTIARPFFIINT